MVRLINELTVKLSDAFKHLYLDKDQRKDAIDNLSSERRVDYTKLRNLLAAKKWKEADQETLAVMLKVSGREKEGCLDISDIEKFPCTDLYTIDTLWTKYSEGSFGFIRQKLIWDSVGGTHSADYETYRCFANLVGWCIQDDWLNYSELNFTSNSPKGNLPALKGWASPVIEVLLSRVETAIASHLVKVSI